MTRRLVVALFVLVAIGCTREIVSLDGPDDDDDCVAADGAAVCDGGYCEAAVTCTDDD